MYPLSVFIAWLLDKLFGDPVWLPHPVVLFGNTIALGEKHLNRGTHRRLKGGILAIVLIILTFLLTHWLMRFLFSLHPLAFYLMVVLGVFFGLAGTTLIREVRATFIALDHSLAEGRRQVARIVGRDTSQLSAQEIRKAALETLAENLSDGVVAPLFWFILLGVPGMMTYKMINTLDSMIAYRTERYREFGTVAARIDDVANYLPARLTAFLMVMVAGRPHLLRFVIKYGNHHASPNSGYPESALAGILNCQFGGTHSYFGEVIEKPTIGYNDRPLNSSDMERACRINIFTEIVMMLLVLCILVLFS
ncbi:MAG: cobalamin biosynthesis protein CobD [Bacteroidaceae bacterium]|nr:cobalamin biosynthesis protein CobD [Bacteroidaceae bacterium]